MDAALVAAKDMVDEVADPLRPHISASRATQKAWMGMFSSVLRSRPIVNNLQRPGRHLAPTFEKLKCAEDLASLFDEKMVVSNNPC